MITGFPAALDWEIRRFWITGTRDNDKHTTSADAVYADHTELAGIIERLDGGA